MLPEELKAALLADGWRIERDGYQWRNSGVDWWAWKRFVETVDCQCNDKPPHIAILPWHHEDRRSVEFSITGEVQGALWVKLDVYSVAMDDAMATIESAKSILITAWNAAASKPVEILQSQDVATRSGV